MDKNKPQRGDEDIAREFDSLFDNIPEPDTTEEIEAYLLDAAYDYEALQANGLHFVNNLLEDNWRFVSSAEIDEAAAQINRTPLRKQWDRYRLVDTIRKVSEALSAAGETPVLAFRNQAELTDADLASVLQELEYKANLKGIQIDID